MAVEIDQSGRVEDLSTGTAVAFANNKKGIVFVTAGTKRHVIVYLRRNSLIPAKDIPAVLFSILIFMLVRNNELSMLKIDEEYTGKNIIIEETLTKLFVRNSIKKIPNVRFVRIGKQSPAHFLAWRTHRSKRNLKTVRKISEKEILKYL